MGQLSGVVVVLPGDGPGFDDAMPTLAAALQPGVARPACKVTARSMDGRTVDVADCSTEFFSMLTWTRHPMGLSVVVLQVSTNALFDEDERRRTVVQDFLWESLTQLGALVGYLSHNEAQRSEEWIEAHVLIPLVQGEYAELQDASVRTKTGRQYDDFLGHVDSPLRVEPLPECWFHPRAGGGSEGHPR